MVLIPDCRVGSVRGQGCEWQESMAVCVVRGGGPWGGRYMQGGLCDGVVRVEVGGGWVDVLSRWMLDGRVGGSYVDGE